MKSSWNRFVIVLSAACLAALLTTNVFATTFNYNDFSDKSELTLVASAATHNDSLRLNGTGSGTSGAVWRQQKEYVAAGFSTSYTFTIGKITQDPGSDLLAFVVQNNSPDAISWRGPNDPPGGTDMVANHLVIFLDTFQNPWDTSNWHFDVYDVNEDSLETNYVANATIAGGKNPSQHVIDINYDALTENLKVYFDNALYVDINYDLAKSFPLDKGTAWVGFVGSSGVFAETHDVHTWSFSSVPEPNSFFLAVAALLGFAGTKLRPGFIPFPGHLW